MNVKKTAAVFSITIPIISAILIINFFTGVMSIPWQGMPVFFPLLLSPIGIILAFVSIKTVCFIWDCLKCNYVSISFFLVYRRGFVFWSLKSIRHYAYTLVFSNLSKEGIKKFRIAWLYFMLKGVE